MRPHDNRETSVAPVLPSGNGSGVPTRQRGDKGRWKTANPGLRRLTRALKTVSRESRHLDGRTTLAQTLKGWRRELTAACGGTPTGPQKVLIETLVKTVLILQGLDGWLLTRPDPPLDRVRKTVWPIVRERTALVDSLYRGLAQLTGTDLDSRGRDVPLEKQLEALSAAQR